MSPLADIPVEIANHILGFVPTSDLLNLCLTKRSLRTAAEPFLYSTIRLGEYDTTPRIVPLLRTLLQRPELWDYIENVYMDGSGFLGHVFRALDLNSVDIPVEQCLDAIKKTKVPYTDLWIAKLNSSETSLEALYAVFLAGLSNSKRLALTGHFINKREIIGKVIQSKALGEFGLSKLEQLREVKYDKFVDNVENKNNKIFPDVISLFYLPSLTSIEAWVPNPPVFEWPAGEPNLDHLTSLNLTRLSEDNLGKILALTRNLKSLTWTRNWDQTDDPGNTMELNFENIIERLSLVRGTLEELRIRLEIRPDFKPELNVTGSLAGLAGFRGLTYLEVPFISLAGFGETPLPIEDSVPPSVKTLALSDDLLLNSAVRWQQPYFEEHRIDYAPAVAIGEHIEALCDNIPTQLPLLRDLIFFADNSFAPIFERIDFDDTMALYTDDGFNMRVSTRY
ncbi:unnamed protein product [Clonostachys byssicola]|uniref:F-box domain-containing protein n=1 Tax=Clonostachys byssicola TaxID=160290 RepID=A0A9N9U873_9HYPO|nr:unnamed protein product [Clonostachys byssicola]